ncbi:zinc-dependent peptidase [Xanthomonas prunicola]|uniref:Zinc-dependent peptidase n=1 Tax=Xanthomonas prunicola TaxID=2053930 RepID=A0A9Q9J763_9XANT|nr:M90 family metallopeptidase [Xanthomonas prunicola]USJ02839.1 zinc-dependent peptidase [Xanthomonas prunicola]UXA51159.1 zinc-dependent peptidase [Xanthomonas prunicola]UXA59398.1 zinc-dependent peptidase [Xanthomonas prunicola]UXA63344.1 zinc-dependent peptidase [Xanthomonas prunicola]UXA67600.1 zinc-dependent peptidase [Xanthomonas prunicola]
MTRWLRRPPPELADALWQPLCSRCAWVAALDPPRQQRLRALTAQFLHQKTISPVEGLQLQPHDRLVLAATCCLPLLEIGAAGWRGWSQLIVYPDAFRVQRTHMDAAGVMHAWDDTLIGETWEQGPLIISWADVQADLDDPRAGFNVIVHEMAHKLDALDGALDGTPPLPRDAQRRWARDFQRAYDLFCQRVEAGEDTEIDPYAAQAPEEFFAVVSEYHVSAPQVLARVMPQVAAHLERFYGPSPFAASVQR